MIEVKTGQRWSRGRHYDPVVIVGYERERWWYEVLPGRHTGGSISAEGLNERCTLMYDPDEGEAPEVGSRWRRDDNQRTCQVVAIVGNRSGSPRAQLKWSAGKRITSWSFRGSRELQRLPDEPTQPECYANKLTADAALVGGAMSALGRTIAAFLTRQKPTRDDLLEHWMSLRPEDLHEGGWRRVGVAQISGDADMDDGLHTIESVADVADGIAHGIQRGSPWSFVRLYREEERRGKWWV